MTSGSTRMRIVTIVCVLFIAAPALGEIAFVNGKWESSFDLPAWDQISSAPLPGEFIPHGNWTCSPGRLGAQITTDAKNPLSKGERGFRHWVGDGVNNNSGGIVIAFPSPQPEIWLRWYMRYEKGFQWSLREDGKREPQYDKVLYIWTNKEGNAVFPSWPSGGRYYINTQAPSGGGAESPPEKGWRYIHGGEQSEGDWHVHEVYLKMDTDGTDGVGRLWIDEELIVETVTANFSGGGNAKADRVAREGWVRILIGSNQKAPDNGKCMAVDYDDFVIYIQEPPNTDRYGNSWIGPIEHHDSGKSSSGGGGCFFNILKNLPGNDIKQIESESTVKRFF